MHSFIYFISSESAMAPQHCLFVIIVSAIVFVGGVVFTSFGGACYAHGCPTLKIESQGAGILLGLGISMMSLVVVINVILLGIWCHKRICGSERSGDVEDVRPGDDSSE